MMMRRTDERTTAMTEGRHGMDKQAEQGRSDLRGWTEKQGKVFWYLKKVPMISELSASDWEWLQPRVTLWEIRRRTIVYLPSDWSESVFFINGGRIKVSRVTRDGREVTLRYLGPEDMFGEQCLFRGGARNEMAETTETSLVTEVPRKDFEALVERRPQLSRQLLTLMIQTRVDIEERVQNLLFTDVRGKLAGLLLQLADQHGVDEGEARLIQLRITHQEMANLIGATRETVSLTLSEFKRQGLITSDHHFLVLLDEAPLRAML